MAVPTNKPHRGEWDYQFSDYPVPYSIGEADDGTITLLTEDSRDLLTESGQRLIT